MESTSTSGKSPRRQLLFGVDSESGEECGNIMNLNCRKNINLLHSRMPAEMIPQIGKEFDDEEEAWEFYKSYARQVGFGIRRQGRYNDKNGILLDRTIVCCAEGKRKQDKRDDSVKNHRPETRFGCMARMRISRKNHRKFRITEFEQDHTHYLCSPNKTHMLKTHRGISSTQAAEMETATSVGIAPKAAHDLMAIQAGGKEVLGFVAEDYKNYLRTKRKELVGDGNTGGVLEYLREMQLKDPSFFYAIQLDSCDLVTNIFWADGKMRADYLIFGDVVCFDTTYKKNNEGRPVAFFVGVNHHKQSTLFGTALMYDETADSFKWLFDTFSRAMGGVKPKSILTDQDVAMSKALTLTWPETYHRLCVWHIFQNALSHLSHVFGEFNNFSKDFSRCIYEYEDEEDFFEAWNSMLDKYNLQDNAWLKRLFDLREKWALVYGRFTFCADMNTTQRSESMNALLKRYVSYKKKFLEFFSGFDMLIADRRYNELKADFKANISVPSLKVPCELLKHSRDVYTPEVHKWFQDEYLKSIDMTCVECGDLGSVIRYKVTPYKKTFSHTVVHDESCGTYTCSCKKFEFAGILCSHVLKLFSVKTVTRIPDAYILKRWTRKAKAHIQVDDSVVDRSDLDPQVLYTLRYKDLCHLYVQLARKAAETEETYVTARKGLLEMVDTLDAILEVHCLNEKEKGDETEEEPIKESCLEPVEDISSKVKGIKEKKKTTSGKRFKSSVEMGSKKKKKTGLAHMKKKRNATQMNNFSIPSGSSPKNNSSMPSGSSPRNNSSMPSGSSSEIHIQASCDMYNPWSGQQQVHMPSASSGIHIQAAPDMYNPSFGQPIHMPNASSRIQIQAAPDMYNPSFGQPIHMPRGSHDNRQQFTIMHQTGVPVFGYVEPSHYRTQSVPVFGYVGDSAAGSNSGRCKCHIPCVAGMLCRSSGHIV